MLDSFSLPRVWSDSIAVDDMPDESDARLVELAFFSVEGKSSL